MFRRILALFGREGSGRGHILPVSILGVKALLRPEKQSPQKHLVSYGFQVGDAVLNSPLASGKVVGITNEGYPTIDPKDHPGLLTAVAWIETETYVFDPRRLVGGTRLKSVPTKSKTLSLTSIGTTLYNSGRYQTAKDVIPKNDSGGSESRASIVTTLRRLINWRKK